MPMGQEQDIPVRLFSKKRSFVFLFFSMTVSAGRCTHSVIQFKFYTSTSRPAR
jgi:hypothetical protein